MISTSWLRVACAAIAAVVIGRLLLAYDAFPDRMAMHFDDAGRASGFTAKSEAVAIVAIAQVVFPAWMLASRSLLAFAPNHINFPHKRYYLAPERRAASLERLAGLVDWVALAVALLVAAMAELTIRANLERSAMPLSPGVPVACFFVFIVGWIVRLYRAFPRPREDHSASMP